MTRFALLASFCVRGFVFAQTPDLYTAYSLKKEGRYADAYSALKASADSLYLNDQFATYASTHMAMVECQLELGNPFAAKNLAESTLIFVAKELPTENDLIARGTTLLGRSFLRLGHNDDALEQLQKAEQLFGGTESMEKANCFDALGLAYTNNQNKALASQYHEQALAIRRSIFGRSSLEAGNSFNNLGLVYLTDEPLQALLYFNRAKAIYEQTIGSEDKRTLRVSINMALAHVAQSNFDDAFTLLNEVKAVYDATYSDNHPNKAFILSTIGRVHLVKNELDQALALQNEALRMYIELYGEKHPEVANTYFLIGETYKAKSEFKLAVTFYQQAIYANLAGQSSESIYDLPLIQNYFNADVLLTTLQAKAIALEALHFEKTLNVKDLTGAVDTYKKCNELITTIRQKRLSEADKLKLGQIAKDVYENGIELSLLLSEQSFSKKKHLATAFEFCERSKSSVLLEAITESKAKEFAGIPAALITLEDSLKDEISFLEQKLAAAAAEEEQSLKDVLFSYQNSYREFVVQLETDYPDYYNLKYSETVASVEDIQKKLNPQTALLSYFIGSEELFIFAITQKTIKAYRQPIEDDFERTVKGLRNAIKFDIKKSFFTSAQQLYSLLIPKLPSNIQELIFLPDGFLGTIPFESLVETESPTDDYASASFLLKDYHISYDYSATLFAQRTLGAIVEKPEILLIAPVHFDSNDTKMNSLPGSEKEIKEIQYLFMGNNCESTLQVKSEANEERFKQEDLSQYTFLHFATHGLVNESEPALSRIFLTPNDAEDGSLYTGEIYNLKINADLVTLSACETGLGKVAKGEGIVGLSRALQYAGANNIMVSLWKVADASTSQMMIEFYTYHLSNPSYGYNSALRKAKLSLLASTEYARPYYWAPFVLVGM